MRPGVFHSRRDLRIETVAYPGVPGDPNVVLAFRRAALCRARSGGATKVVITPGVPPVP